MVGKRAPEIGEAMSPGQMELNLQGSYLIKSLELWSYKG